MIDRRRFMALTASAVVGTGAGVAVARLTGDEASIRFIGARNSMMALLDTGNERVFFVLGEHNDEMTANVANLVTVGNGRIDLVVATHRTLSTRAAREHLGIEHITTLCLQTDMSLPTIRGKVTKSAQNIELALGASATLSVRPFGSLSEHSDHPEYIASIGIDGVNLLLGSSPDALRRSQAGPADLVAVPGTIDDETLAAAPSLVVCSAPLTETDTAQIQVFWNDPVIVRINDGAIQFRRDQLSS